MHWEKWDGVVMCDNWVCVVGVVVGCEIFGVC